MKISVYIFLFLLVVSCNEESNLKRSNAVEIATQENPIKLYQKVFDVEKIGDTLDVFNEVYVFYNKSMTNTSGRNVTKDGYNLGLKWQCVEFVKRYYYEYLNHKMPNSYGHAKDFFNLSLKDGQINSDRNLIQFTNGSVSKPKIDDMLIFDGNIFNPYGHIAIISKVTDDSIEIVQQNVGKTSRDNIYMSQKNGNWTIDESSILGWLRKTDQ